MLELEGFEANRDLAWMAELPEESEHDALDAEIACRRPQCLVVVQPGAYRVLGQLQQAAYRAGLPLEVHG